jgi:hypothetical protein
MYVTAGLILKMLEDRWLRRILEPKKEDVLGG